MNQPTTRHLAGLGEVMEQYDALLLDLWGVIHDGNTLYPNVAATLNALYAAGKKILFLSNAPRRASKARGRLVELGIPAVISESVMTSGEATYQFLASALASQNSPAGAWRSYAFCGPDRDRGLLDGLPYVSASGNEADFLLNVGFTDDNEPVSYWMPLLQDCRARGLPMLCANPDRIVVRLNGEVLPCAGQLADAYLAMGGEVQYFGKPYPDVYAHCFQHLEHVAISRILAVGDSLETDILGGQSAGVDTVLITGGILKPQLINGVDNTLNVSALSLLCEESGATPTYSLPALVM